MVRRWVRMVGGMKAWRREADFIIRRRAINRGRGITAGVYPLPDIFREPEEPDFAECRRRRERQCRCADTRDLTRWTNARRKEAGRKTPRLPRLISEERSARAGARTISPLEGNSRHLAFPLCPGLPSRSSGPQPDHSHLPSTSYPTTKTGTRSSVMAELRAQGLIYQRVFDIPPIFLLAKLLFVSISVLVELYAYNPRHGKYGTASLQISKDQKISKYKT